tara:strand:+ start:691 stop:870 length:180 start_codon:yes stop_codon:yes gene_type:complete
MTQLTTTEIIQIATKVADRFDNQSKEAELTHYLQDAITFKDRAIGVRVAINEILKTLNL